MTITKAAARSVAFVDQTGQLGGAELSLLDIVRQRPSCDAVVLFDRGPFEDALRDAGIGVEICQLNAAVSAMRKDAGMLRWCGAGRQVVQHVRALRRTLNPFHLVYANTPKALTFSALANVGSRRKLIYHLRDLVTADHFSASNRKLLVTLANRCADLVIANSEATSAAFVEAGGNPALTNVIHNGIDPAPYRAIANRDFNFANRLRRILEIEDQPIVAIFGRLSPWKGQNIAIEAVSRLPDVHLLVVGDALFGERDYRAQLERQVIELGVENRVHFLGFRADVPDLMNASDVIAHCSVAPEPFGRVVVEGMLSNRAVVAADGGGVREIIQSGRTGVLVEPGSVEQLVSALEHLLKNPSVRKKIAAEGRSHAEERFSLQSCVGRVNAAIAGL